MIILALETSCDETAASIVQENNGTISILSNIIASQADIHAQYGGVIPEIAARNHIRAIIPVIQQAFDTAHLSHADIDAIAVTQGPGLIAALHIGVETAKALAFTWNKPLIPINHMAGHIYSTMTHSDDFTFPALALLVSGGHTQLVVMKGHYNFEIIGSTIDDAVGEAFDKVAKLMGLPYPGGPSIEKEATEYAYLLKKPSQGAVSPPLGGGVDGEAGRGGMSIKFPRPLIDSNDFNFSYSGLKTAVRYFIEAHPNYNRAHVAYEFQNAAIDVLVAKTIKAIEHYRIKTLIIGGGVAANKHLRNRLTQALNSKNKTTPASPPLEGGVDGEAGRGGDISIRFPLPGTSADNAAMIGIAAIIKTKYTKKISANKTITADPNLPLV